MQSREASPLDKSAFLSLPLPSQSSGGTGMALTLCPSRPQLGSRRLRRVQRLLRGRPAGEGRALRGGPGDPPEAAAPCPVQSAGPRAGSGGSLQPPGLPGEVSAGRRGGESGDAGRRAQGGGEATAQLLSGLRACPTASPTLAECPFTPRTLAGPHRPRGSGFGITVQETLGRPFPSLNPQIPAHT